MRNTEFSIFICTAIFLAPSFCAAQSLPAGVSRSSAWGKVVAAENERPVQHARVEFKLSTEELQATAYTDREGKFDIKGLPQGVYSVTLCAPDCKTVEESEKVEGPTGPVVLHVKKEEAAAPDRETFVVNVNQMKISGKAHKAFEKGAKLLSNGKTEESMAFFERAIADSPAYYEAHYNMGIALARLGRLDQAAESIQKAIDLTDGRYAIPQFGMGMVLCKQGQYEQAEKVIERGLEHEPGSALGRYFLGWAQFGLRRLADAEKNVRFALFRDGNQPAAYYLLAKIHEQENNSYAVIQDVEDYLKLDASGPGSTQARLLLQKAQRALQQGGQEAVVAVAMNR